ncbi:DUF3825 domain-containing protein [Desulfurispora thermophila]|uniref:DUF3825 domain-containing protein n=1 Tax=Desulfurispora thermophila TaxID=265470 RepID=UPI000361138B|nr:DUF3825 domain-containing protein [Desulfurispora thermophila]
MMSNIVGRENELFTFAYCPRFKKQLSKLASLAQKEVWDFKIESEQEPKFEILDNYIKHTFKRIKYEYDLLPEEKKHTKLCIEKDYACFNTGLYTENYEQIFAFFQKNQITDKQEWCLIGFFKESSDELVKFSKLPQRASYFQDISDLIFDYRCEVRIDLNHILDENRDRLPESLRDLSTLTGAVEIAKKRVAANYKLAIPQYYDGRIQLLIPLCSSNNECVALVIRKESEFYVGKTVLKVEWAYNNARLIARPESEWLKPMC